MGFFFFALDTQGISFVRQFTKAESILVMHKQKDPVNEIRGRVV